MYLQNALFFAIYFYSASCLFCTKQKIKNACHKTRFFGIYIYRKAFPPPGAPAKGGPQKKFLKIFKIFVTKRPEKGI